MDKDKKNPRPSSASMEAAAGNDPELDDLMRTLQPEMRRPKPSPADIAAALEAAQRLAAVSDSENASENVAQQATEDANALVCSACGYLNRQRTRFCAMCGVGVDDEAPGTGASPGSQALMHAPQAYAAGSMPPQTRGMGNESHHYHHHYHHHYFPGGQEGTFPRAGVDPAREEKTRPNLAMRGDMSRAEAAVRRVTQEWVLACNTKHLDDLLELYGPDPMVLRSNCAPIRGMAAVREFFFGALDSGLGEVEMEPLRVEIVGDLAYEAGRCKALVPGAIGKRREERAKYLWVCHRQGNGEWKLVADCWSSDLTLSTLESDIPSGAGVKSNSSRKG